VIILRCLCEGFYFLLFFSLQIYFFFHFANNFSELHSSYRLQHVFAYIILNCFLCIFKFPEATEDHNYDLRVIIMQKMAQFHSIHIRHQNICENNIYRMALHKICCLLSVFAVSYKLAIHGLPVNILLYGVTYQDLIIYK